MLIAASRRLSSSGSATANETLRRAPKRARGPPCTGPVPPSRAGSPGPCKPRPSAAHRPRATGAAAPLRQSARSREQVTAPPSVIIAHVLAAIFWICVGLLVYTHVGYPLLLARS